MTKIKIFIIILFGFSIFVSGQTTIPMGQNIDKSKEIGLNGIAENIRFIPLETNADCLLDTDISKMEVFEETIFISDYRYIFKFDLNGKFLKRIGKLGRGPGEYAQGFQTFLMDKTNRNLIVFDMISQKMIVYDLDGNFVQEEKIDFLPGPFEWISEEKLAVYNMGFTYEKEPWNDFYILNKEAKIIQKNKFKKQADKRYGLMIYPAVFYRYNGKTRYKNPHENIIYELDEKNKPDPVYELDYGKYEKFSDADDVEIQIKNNVGTNRSNPDSFEKIGLLRLSENNDLLFIYYGHQEQRKAGVFYKKENTFFNLFVKDFELYGFQDDFYHGLPVFPKAGISNNNLYSYYTAFEFKEYLKGAKNLDNQLKKIVNKLDENNNPVVMIAKLKE